MFMRYLKTTMMALAILCGGLGLTSCESDGDNVLNPAEESVLVQKQHDTAILLCTFGSTFTEPIETYDALIADYADAFPDADIYLSFTSRTCVNRVKAATGIDRYQPDLWLNALGEAGYRRVAVQSLHVIPGEEYLSLMNTDVKKNFMIDRYPSVQVVKSPCLLYDEADVSAVAQALYGAYEDVLADPARIVLLMGHGNPDENYNANSKYAATEAALQALASNGNVFIGTVDYGPMLFWPLDDNGRPLDEANDESVYAKLTAYLEEKGLDPADVTIHLAPFMSVAGDHAHNDLWGIEEGDDATAATPQSDACWRLKLMNMGFRVDLAESHHGGAEACQIVGLADYPELRAFWLNHLKALYGDEAAWETGEDYQ